MRLRLIRPICHSPIVALVVRCVAIRRDVRVYRSSLAAFDKKIDPLRPAAEVRAQHDQPRITRAHHALRLGHDDLLQFFGCLGDFDYGQLASCPRKCIDIDIQFYLHLRVEASSAMKSREPLRSGNIGYAAFFPFSANPASARKIPAAPLRRAFGDSHSSKNTTFMSGRTRAPSGCLAM